MEENKKLLLIIIQKQEEITSRLGNIERHLFSYNRHLPSNIPHTPYLPTVIPPHSSLPTHVSSPPISTFNQINTTTSTFTDMVTISIESIGRLHNKCNLYRKYRMFTKQCNFVWCGWTEGRVDLIEKTIY